MPPRKTHAQGAAERAEQLAQLVQRSARRERVLRQLARRRGQSGTGFR